ncbi:MBL fold metallo-hydrolase [Solihabitans fulvus]|uniref:MBL fold metallo-hydrolase n=1 Tax=Solihabitans fulvus TaxID=1892852 RepID=A0A5B2XD51_9PSEU|nr:MBL fold metallo-hydrolase [Solihabitans fulvus]KAA2261597.1 MBL fold metallo-hydrolase [Solihabitans fulvus]
MSLTITILGTASPYPRPDRPCSGYLLRAGDTTVWLDAGPGSLANLLRHTRLERLSAIWLSHLHADHTADLISAYYALAFADLTVPAPIPVFAPPGLGERLAGFFGRQDPSFLAGVFDIRDLHDGHRVEFDGLALTSRAVRHDVEAYGLHARHRDATLVYSGDSGPCAELDELADGADVLLCEADYPSPPAGEPQVHHTPEDAGALARRAGVGRLIVTHLGPALEPEDAATRAGAVFGGPTCAAREGDTHAVRG